MSPKALRRARRRVQRYRKNHPRTWAIGLAAVTVVSICIVVFGATAILARSDVRQAQVDAQNLNEAIIAGDKPAAAKALKSLQSAAHGARSNTDNPLWKVASWAPIVGNDIAAVRDVTKSLDEVASSAMPVIVEVATQLDLNSFSPRDGKLDLAKLATLNGPIAKANTVLAAQKADLAGIRPNDLAGPIRDPIADFVSRIGDAADATRITHHALGLIPSMLGDSKRTYLVVFQNNAEIRATGGLPGSYLVANVEDGKISRGKQGTGSGILPLKKSPIPQTSEEKAIFSGLLGRLFVDTNFTPEFPRTAQFMKAILKKRTDIDIDGVISLDPIAMSYILAGTGPVTLDDGSSLTADNAVSELLNKSYLRFPQQNESDDFFTETAAKLFDFVTDGHGDTGATIRGLVRAAKEQRIYIWSDKQAEQKKLSTMSVSGSLVPDKKDTPTLGVFLNDATGTKLEYYLRYATTVRSVQCKPDGSQTVEARIDMASLAPANAAQLPPSIVTDKYGVAKGHMQYTVRFYLPTGGKLLSVRTDTNVLGTATQMHKGHGVYGIPFLLKPMERAHATIVFRTPPGASKQIQVSTTPSAQAGRNVAIAPSVCR